VFERHGRVGGLCFTLSEGYKSFDLGANYVTPAYRETLKLARSVGARTYRSRQYIAARVPEIDPGYGPLKYTEMTDLVREIHDPQGNPERDAQGRIDHIPWPTLVLAILRYIVCRFRVRRAIDSPWFDRIHEHPDLCVTFGQWLDSNGLNALRSLFEICITLMGYGEINDIAAPYALKFMSLGTFIPVVLRQVPLVGWLFPWPRSFVHGFQRLWEAVSWRLNVRHDVTVERIVRDAASAPPTQDSHKHPIQIDMEFPVGIFNTDETNPVTLWFDYLVVASARVHSLGDRMDIDSYEHQRLKAVTTFAYCMTTFHPEGGFKLPQPVVCVVPFTFEGNPDSRPPRPWAVVQLWPEQTPMLQCYTKLPDAMAGEGFHQDLMLSVRTGAENLVSRLGGKRAGSTDPEEVLWEHYEQWPYFGHVSAAEMAKGFFRDLDQMQGYRNTYWVGGATNFELVEVIVRSAKALVEKHFLGRA